MASEISQEKHEQLLTESIAAHTDLWKQLADISGKYDIEVEPPHSQEGEEDE